MHKNAGEIIRAVGRWLLPLGLLSAALPAAAAERVAWNFDVYLDDREIGYHRFAIERSGDAHRLETEAQFAVKLLFITAYEYEHENTEIWRDGCIERISARTNSNGKRYAVAGEKRDGRLVLQTKSGSSPLGRCVRSFAYWDRSLLDSERLLNSQTGEYLQARLTAIGGGTIEVGGAQIAVNRYRLVAEDMRIELAYTVDGDQWVALDTDVDGGRRLRYRRQPADLAGGGPVDVAARPGASEARP